MLKSFREIEKQAKMIGPMKVVVLFAEDPNVMRTMADGQTLGLIKPILVGNRSRIQTVAREVSMPLEGVEIIDLHDPQKAADLCLEIVVSGRASFIIKGNILTSYLYRALIRTVGDRGPDQVPCTLCFHQVGDIDKVFVVTDPGVNIVPDMEVKRKILASAIRVLHHLGCANPRVMILAAHRFDGLDSIHSKDAALIADSPSNICSNFTLCATNNLYQEYPDHCVDPDTFPDLFVVPNIETGNILIKSIDHLGKGLRQCLTVGGGITILTPSRSDGYTTRMLNLSLGVVLSQAMRRDNA